MDKITKIIIGTESGVWKKAIVLYNDSAVKVLSDKSEIADALSKFAIQDNIWIEDLLSDNIRVPKMDIENEEFKRFSNSTSDSIEEEKNTNVEEKKPVEEKNHKTEKNSNIINEGPLVNNQKKINLRYLAGAAVLLTVLSIGGCAIKKNSGYKTSSQTYQNGFTKKSHSGSANDEFNKKLDQTYGSIDGFVQSVSQIEQRVYTEDEINTLINQINMMSVSGVTELENMLNGQKMKGNNYSISYEQFFTQGSAEYVSLSEFCTLRNDILNKAYNNNVASSKKQVVSFLNYLNNFIMGVKPINGTNIYFSTLSPLARYAVVSLDMAYIQPSALKNYSVTINGQKYNRNQLMNKLQKLLSDTTEDLYSQSATKRH